jgi:radical SAM protein with 4Fe4S-binding SPASM domain
VAAGIWEELPEVRDLLYSPTPLDREGPPEIVEIEPIHTCNLRCTMCHVSYQPLSKHRLRPDFIERLAGLEGKWAKVGSQYEPTAHPQFADIVNGLTDKGLKIDLTTNGTLFTDKLIRRIEGANFQNITISFDGATAATYQRVRRRGRFDQAIGRIGAFRDAVKKHNPDAYFAVNYTFMQSNVAEAAAAAEMWDRLGFDHIGFISMTIPGENGASDALASESPSNNIPFIKAQMREVVRRIMDGNLRITASSPWFHDVEVTAPHQTFANAGLIGSDHPRKRWPSNPISHFQNGHFPRVPVACRSPYKLARIDYTGNVYLCNRYVVGSIYNADLLTLWNGRPAQRLRRNVERDRRVCETCDYFRFCIRANEVDYSDQTVFEKQTNQHPGYDPTLPTSIIWLKRAIKSHLPSERAVQFAQRAFHAIKRKKQ